MTTAPTYLTQVASRGVIRFQPDRPDSDKGGLIMRVGIYTRISTDEEHQPYSLSAQFERLSKYIDSQEDWHLVRRFSDQMSGASLERPGMKSALAEARMGAFDLLLVYRVDRLSRSVRGLAQILEELDVVNVGFRSATEPFDTTTPAGRMMVQMLGVFAEFERSTIIDRVIAGMERKAAGGGWCGGQRPFGYALDKQRDCLLVHETESPLVPVIFRMYTERRLGANAIAAWLNGAGHRTRQGRPWSHASVLTVLRNRVYLGEVYFRGAHHQAAHPPLIDSVIFDAAHALLEERNRDRSLRRSNSSNYLLSGLVVCAQCGKHYVGAAAHGRSGRYPYYVCFSRQRYGKSACPAERLPAEELDDAILAALCDTYERTDLIEEALRKASASFAHEQSFLSGELSSVKEQLAKVESAIDRYLDAFESGALSETTLAPRLDKLSRQITELRDRQEEIQLGLEREDHPEADISSFANLRHEIGDLLAKGETSTRKALLKALIEVIRVDDRKQIYPTFRVPVDAVRIEGGVAVPTGFEPVSPP